MVTAGEASIQALDLFLVGRIKRIGTGIDLIASGPAPGSAILFLDWQITGFICAWNSKLVYLLPETFNLLVQFGQAIERATHAEPQAPFNRADFALALGQAGLGRRQLFLGLLYGQAQTPQLFTDCLGLFA